MYGNPKKRTALIGLSLTLLFGCAGNTTRPVVDGGQVSTTGNFVNATGQARGGIQIEFAFDALTDVQRFPDSSQPWLVLSTDAVRVSYSGDDAFMSRVAAGLEGGTLLLKYQAVEPGPTRLVGQILVRQADGTPFQLSLASEFSGRPGTNGVPAVDDLVNLRARVQIRDGGVSQDSTIRCDAAVLSIRGVATLAQQVE